MSDVKFDAGDLSIGGYVGPGFESIRTAFIANFEEGLEVGASCAVYLDGVKVVDIWGGIVSPTNGQIWAEETIAPVNSVTKGATALCIALLVEEGLLDPLLPVRFYWPEFAAAGKEEVTIRELLSHQAGLPIVEGHLEFDDIFESAQLAAMLSTQAPIWPRGTIHGYHAFTFGALADALVRRITGRTVGRFLSDEIARPLGLDLYIGLPESEISRVAPLIDPLPQTRNQIAAAILDPEERTAVLNLVDDLGDPSSLISRASTFNGALPGIGSGRKDPRFLTKELPSSNAVTNARSLAAMYAASIGTFNGFRLLSDETLDVVTSEAANGPDAVLHFPTRFGVGFQLPLNNLPMLGPNSFGHPGAGGALGFADRKFGLGFGYVQNQLGRFAAESRTERLLIALRHSLRIES